MFIKEVIICGFKSYKETTKIQNFHPGYNVIVGRNGSGKSNFFAALEFALRTDSRALKLEERNALLFQGKVTNDAAYVEVVFDNKERKLPYNTDTVTFRRVIGTKKDRFFVNKKESHNIKQFLDSAGITNPYYVVKQGKINEMASANEKARLQVLYDISGSKVYDEKKLQAHKMLEECNKKLGDVDKLILSIDEHFETLEEQSRELQKFLTLEKKKRAVEYLVHNRDKVNLASRVASLQVKQMKLMAECEPLQKDLHESKRQIDDIDAMILSLQQQVIFLETKKNDIETEIPVTSSRIAVAENQLKDALENYALSLQSANKLQTLNRELVSTNDELQKLSEHISKIKQQEIVRVDEYNLCKSNMAKLKEKCGRTAQFATKAERDAWISGELNEVNGSIDSESSLKISHEENLAKINHTLKLLSDDLTRSKDEWENHRKKLIELDASTYNCNYNLMLEKRTTLWNDTNKIEQQINTAKDNSSRFMDLLSKNGGNALVAGWKSVQCILKDLRQNDQFKRLLTGYYGIVMENIDCDSDINVAVEVTAGMKLFYHVVESHQVSRVIMAEFNRRKLKGEVNFIPLTELMVHDRQYPENSNECCPLFEKIIYKSNVVKAIQFVFGGTLLCVDLEVATRFAKTFKMNCVTVDGDKVFSKGAMTGGYHNQRLSKIELGKQLQNETSRIEELHIEKSAKEEELLNTEKFIVEFAKKKEKAESAACAVRSSFEKIQLQKDIFERKLHHHQLQQQQEKRAIEAVEVSIKNLLRRRENLEEELSERMSEKSSQYAQQMKKFLSDVSKKMQNAEAITKLRKEKESMRNKLEKSIVITEKKIEETKLLGSSANVLENVKNKLKKELDGLNEIRKKQAIEWNNATKEYSAIQEKINGVQVSKEKCLEVLAVHKDKVDTANKELERVAIQQSESRRSLGDIHGTILKLGTIPADIEQYEEIPTNDLCKELKKISKGLRSLGKVNKKATEKLERATKVKKELLQEKSKYNEINTKIMDLDKTLDDKKGEAVFKVFQTVHQQFRSIFNKFVPEGNIRMFLRTQNGGQVNAAADVDGEDGEAILSLFRENQFEGLAIDVNFVGKELKGIQTRDLRSFSGGQKTLISLALLLAIQRCDPVPLYIFDEIDQALDRKYRSSVAEVIKELAQKAQFICTTFSRQFIDKSDAAFGVYFRNQASKILPITIQQALSFVKNDSQTSPDNVFGDETSDATDADAAKSYDSGMPVNSDDGRTGTTSKTSKNQNATNNVEEMDVSEDDSMDVSD